MPSISMPISGASMGAMITVTTRYLKNPPGAGLKKDAGLAANCRETTCHLYIITKKAGKNMISGLFFPSPGIREQIIQ
ncbi:MAG: hypothetical protein K6T66_02590 [Peptococcaceae bacterium]|nr:hypothetical protein [Peptococcaceae bacterium]